jgi:hypothetical protein
MKKIAKAALAGAAVAAAGLATASSANASSYDIDPVSDGEAATCAVFNESFTGYVPHDADVAIGVTVAQSQWYHIPLLEAANVTNQQVYTYCPQFWPNLVAIGNAARSSGPGYDNTPGSTYA